MNAISCAFALMSIFAMAAIFICGNFLFAAILCQRFYWLDLNWKMSSMWFKTLQHSQRHSTFNHFKNIFKKHHLTLLNMTQLGVCDRTQQYSGNPPSYVIRACDWWKLRF